MKTKTYRKISAPLVGVALALVSGAATQVGAAILWTDTYTVSKPTQLTELNYNITLPKFDLSLGTLLEVDIELVSNLSTILTVTNGSVDSSTGNAVTTIKFYLADPGQYLQHTVASETSNPSFLFGTKQSFDQPLFYTLPSGGQTTSDPIEQQVDIIKTYTTANNANFLSEFSTFGSQTLTLVLSSTTSTLLDNTGGNTTSSQVTQGDVAVSVKYKYNDITAIPEPTTWVMLLGGMGMVAFGQRLRRRL